jgi:hypothetical protein
LKRDAIQHPFLTDLHSWASSVRHYQFADMGVRALNFGPSDGKEPASDPNITERAALNHNNLYMMYRTALKRFGESFDSLVIKSLRAFRYNVTNIGIGYLDPSELVAQVPVPVSYIFVQESNLKGPTRQLEMSAGMLRALNIAVQLNFWVRSQEPVCMLVDDIGEGLDFDRSTRVIRHLVSQVRHSGIQLIMTTNDRFIVNSAPLDDIAILQREGNKVRLINRESAPDEFERFSKLGLNNFDLFARGPFRSAKQ